MMRHPRRSAACLALAVLLALHGCVELTGQRLTWFHDVLRDNFHVLIQYDGIHEGSGVSKKGEDQIPRFVKEGDIMLFDWYGHMARTELQNAIQDQDPIQADVAKLLLRLQVEIVGHYREPDGRIGAAQLVTIPEFKSFLRDANALINRALLQFDDKTADEPARRPKVLRHTLQKVLTAARSGHAWIASRGHSLTVTVPVDQDEWAEYKGDGLVELFRESVREMAKALDAKSSTAEIERVIRFVAGVPFSYVESGDHVSLTLGNPHAPRTIHVAIRDDYNTKLENVVAKNVEVDMDAALRQLLLDENARPDGVLRKIRHWLPAEVEVAALLAAAVKKGDDAGSPRDAAIARLREYGQLWNKNLGYPPAPESKGVDPQGYLDQWRGWYARRRHAAGGESR